MPVDYLATLVKGLRHDSRLATSISGYNFTHTEFMLARIADELAFQSWTKSKDAQNNRNRPQSLVKIMRDGPEEKETKGFTSPSAYETARAKILREVNK